jgi:hypothetical protein
MKSMIQIQAELNAFEFDTELRPFYWSCKVCGHKFKTIRGTYNHIGRKDHSNYVLREMNRLTLNKLKKDKKMKHTKGKWNLFLQDDNGYGITNGDSVIAIAGEDDLPENEANANLIASAPEMLKALKDSLFVLREYRIEESRQNELWDLIAKAEGGA